VKKKLNFNFVKFHGKPVPLERTAIAAQRFEYLIKILQIQDQGYTVYYQDEIWCNENQSISKGWHIPAELVIGGPLNRNNLDFWLKGIGHRFSDNIMIGNEIITRVLLELIFTNFSNVKVGLVQNPRGWEEE